MGCKEVKDKDDNIPKLIMTFETGKEEQKDYCMNLKSQFQPDNDIKFEIAEDQKFCIKIISPKGIENIIQSEFVDTPESIKENLDKMIKIVDNPSK